MKNSLLKNLALMLSGVMVMSCLAGCGDTKTSKEPSSSVQQESSSDAEASTQEIETEPSLKDLDWSDVEFRIGFTGSDAQINGLLSVIESFESDYNKLFVNAEFAGWGDYISRQATQAAGRQFADVLITDYSRFKGFADEGLLLPLNEYIESGKLDLSGVSEANIQAGTIDGKVVAVALGNNTSAFTYNPALLEKAGVTMSEAPDLEEFTEVCKKVYDAIGAQIHPGAVGDQIFKMWGSYILSDDGKSLALTEDQFVAFCEWYCDGIEYGFIRDLHNGKGLAKGLKEEVYWAGWIWSNEFVEKQASAGIELKLMPMPSAIKGEYASYLQPTLLWSVSADTENPDLAVEFLNYYINNKESWNAMGSLYGSPLTPDGRAYVSRSASGADKQCLEFISWISEKGYVCPIYKPTPAVIDEILPILQSVRDKVGLLEIKKEEIRPEVQNAIKQINALLAQQ